MATPSDKQFRQKVDALADHKFFKAEAGSAATNEKAADDEYTKLPTAIKYRVQVLRKMQLDEVQARAELEEAYLILQQKYHKKLRKVHEKRKRIIEGTYAAEPSEQLKPVVDDATYRPTQTIAGIPQFWYRVLENAEMTSGWIDENDQPALEKLKDIRIVFGDPENQVPEEVDEAGGDVEESACDQFSIEFEFENNAFFEDKVLRKTYQLGLRPEEEENPFEYEGAVIKGSVGTNIRWKKDKCLSYKIVNKKQRNPKSGATRTVKRKEKQDSFFNFFENLPEITPKDNDEQREEKEEEIELDQELGLYFRDKIVPNAVLMFTNEFVDDEVESGSDSDSDDSDEQSDSDESEDDDQEIEQAEKPDCKQQ